MTLTAAVQSHDERVARALGDRCELHVGGEPTFTRADRTDPPWTVFAEGGDKAETAAALVAALAPRLEAASLPVVGRHYDGEPAPRFCYGVRWRRGGGDPGVSHPLDAEPLLTPPSSAEHAWLTVTPDPGVIEVNMAPCRSLADFARQAGAVYEAAAEIGLSPERFGFNGDASDSGGGGQLTFGGPTPHESPFFRVPGLLPGLVRYLNHHPALSYLFGGDCLGSAGQGPRPDEGNRERFEELALLLDRRAAGDEPAALWRSFAPLLVDPSGNTHRAEVNVEKLYNPGLAGRGCLGLVELRSLRMPPSPERLVAVAALFRSVLARLVAEPFTEPVVHYGDALHDRFALPSVLELDLRAVLDDLAVHGLALDAPLAGALLGWHPPLCELVVGGTRVRITPAHEFWPLVGDVASQERHGARLVDASIRRLEVCVEGGPLPLVTAEGVAVPLRALGDGRHAGGVRYRAYVPDPGFHPDLPANDPLTLAIHGDEAVQLRWYQWQPAGGAYPGLPADAREAGARREERVVLGQPRPGGPPIELAAGRWTVDVRGCSP